MAIRWMFYSFSPEGMASLLGSQRAESLAELRDSVLSDPDDYDASPADVDRIVTHLLMRGLTYEGLSENDLTLLDSVALALFSPEGPSQLELSPVSSVGVRQWIWSGWPLQNWGKVFARHWRHC